MAIARVLVGPPRLLLADEPTGALNSVAGAQILELLGALRDGMSVLLVSYQPAAAVSTRDLTGLADRDRAPEGALRARADI